jgi:ribosomal protein S18 acetylase RimI-like enzyme
MNTADVRIRRLTADDAELFRSIRLEALRREADAFGSTHEAECDKPLSWFADRLGGSHALGAFRGEALVGIAVLIVGQGPKMTHKGHLVSMYVRPEARRASIGRRLVEATIDIACRHVELVQLSVVKENAAARCLYAGLGFVEYGLEKKALKHGGRYFDEILMAKDLAADQSGDVGARAEADDKRGKRGV